MSMAVIVPSRGRPGNIEQLIEACEATCTHIDLWVCWDYDDPERDGYEAVTANVGEWVHTAIAPHRRRLGDWLNYMAPRLAALDDCDVVGFMGDDHRPRTSAWADIVGLNALESGAVVYGNDLIQGAALPTAVFMDSRIIRSVGWFVLPGQTHLFMDNLWKTLGEQLGTLRYLPDVIIEHVHPIAGKAEWDDGYREANDGAVWEHDEALYKEWVAFQMRDDIAKIKAAL